MHNSEYSNDFPASDSTFALKREVPLLKRFGIIHLGYAVALLASSMAFVGGSGLVIATLILMLWIFVFSKDRLSPGCAAGLIVGTLFLCLFCLPIAFLISSPDQQRNEACEANVCQLGQMVAEYSRQTGHVPGLGPDQARRPVNQPKHSWRVYLLPLLGRGDLFDQYDFDEPWDGPNNSKLLDQMPDAYRCPSHPSSRNTHIFMVIDVEGGMNKATNWYREDKLSLIEDINRNVPWTKPEDVTIEDALDILTDQSNECPHVYEDSFSKVYMGRSVSTSAALYHYSMPTCIPRKRLVPFLDDSDNLTPLWEVFWDYRPSTEFKVSGLISVALLLALAITPIFYVGRENDNEMAAERVGQEAKADGEGDENGGR